MELYPRALRCHPALGFHQKARSQEGNAGPELPGDDCSAAGRRQPCDNRSPDIPRERERGRGGRTEEGAEFLSGGPAIRLFDATEELALAEGIETGLAVHLSLGVPVWASYSASNLEHIWIPPSVKRVRIYADNDANFAGQAAAYALARRLKSEEKVSGKRDVRVFVPQKVNTDWADRGGWASRQRKAA